MTENGKRIVILQYQYSVVMGGIERRLKETGYEVEVLEDFQQIVKYIDWANVFLTYLPADILGNVYEQDQLDMVCKKLNTAGGKMIIMGESVLHSKLRWKVPLIGSFSWLDNPVKIDELMAEIEKVVSSAEKKKILIIDDDPSYAGMVREWIKDEFRTDVVTAGMQAIKFLLRKPVDLILLDYEMPVVDGPQVLQMLRQEEVTKNIPVVFLTGVGTKESVERVLSLHPAGYILKSTSRDQLLDYLKSKFE